jgi:hypothetical protein
MNTNRRRILTVALLAAGAAAWGWWPNPAAQRLRRWTAVDEGEVAAFWNCLLAREMSAGDLENGQQARRLAEAAYAGQKQAFPRQLTSQCLPRLATARRTLGELGPPAPALARYLESLADLEAATRAYGQRLATRQATKDLDESIVEHARAWYADAAPTARSIAYQRFLACAVPEVDGLADDPALYRHLAARCFAADPVPFMHRVRATCAPLLRGPAPATATDSTMRKKFHSTEAVQIDSWESCSDIARAQERLGDGSALVRATEAYLRARPAGNKGGDRS